jgi:hypothetical protein
LATPTIRRNLPSLVSEDTLCYPAWSAVAARKNGSAIFMSRTNAASVAGHDVPDGAARWDASRTRPEAFLAALLPFLTR